MRYLTGHTRGLGKAVCQHFDCVGIGRPQYNLETDIDKICDLILEDDLIMLNAYANGTQIEYVKKLYNKASIIVFGSIAATYKDPNLLSYSQHKKELENEFLHMAIHSKKPMLYLKLTGSSYNSPQLIINSIEFWMLNPKVTSIEFNVDTK